MRTLTMGLALLTTLAAGCGEAAYKAGLGRTIDYYEHLELVEDSLRPAYVTPAGLVSLRVPKQFVPMPVPTQDEVDAAAAAGERSPLDDLHPSFLGVRLPGLVGTWSVLTPVTYDGVESEQPTYLYLCTNEGLLGGQAQQTYEQAADGETVDAGALGFISTVEATLANAFGVSIPEGVLGEGDAEASSATLPTNTRYVELYPGRRFADFYDRQPVTEIEFRPLNDVAAFEVPYRIHLYELEPIGTDVRAAVLLVVPEGIDPRQRLDERLELMLATAQLGN